MRHLAEDHVACILIVFWVLSSVFLLLLSIPDMKILVALFIYVSNHRLADLVM